VFADPSVFDQHLADEFGFVLADSASGGSALRGIGQPRVCGLA
jgi:hypothetical protein